MSDFARRVVSYALLRQGQPYVWGAKGLLCWAPTGPVPTPIKAGCNEAYDCIGLITAAVYAAGGPDLRFEMNCQVLWNEGSMPALGEQRRLRLFGPSPQSVTHVSIELGPDYQLEANGGDHTTTNLMAATKRGAKVRVTDIDQGRQDFLGVRSLAALQHYKPKGSP